jgi:potassium-transporting ATPase KdpC subunit
MIRDTVRALVALTALTAVCGLVYPLVVWGVAQTAMADQANGSLIERDGQVVGSRLIGQPFTSDGYFVGRPSAGDSGAGDSADEVAPVSGGSNLGPNSRELADTVRERIEQVAAREGIGPDEVPVDLVTASASGLDPDISPRAARIQVARVARARSVDRDIVDDLVRRHTTGATLGTLGAARVRVLELNLALDRQGG